jgi:hypothetical protein
MRCDGLTTREEKGEDLRKPAATFKTIKPSRRELKFNDSLKPWQEFPKFSGKIPDFCHAVPKHEGINGINAIALVPRSRWKRRLEGRGRSTAFSEVR